MQLTLLNVRLSYPHLFAPKAAQGSTKPKYSASLLLDKTKDAKQIKAIEAALAGITTEKFKGKKLPADKLCLKDGDTREDANYEGAMFINASSDRRPQVVDRDKSPLTADDDKPYAGCYVNAIIRLWGQDNEFGKRINASLEVVQFVKDGDRFGTAPASADDLPDLPDDDGYDDL